MRPAGRTIGGLPATMRRRLHGLRRLLPAGPRRRLSRWLRRKGFKPDAHYTVRIEYPTSASNAPRWNPHPELERIIASGDATYRTSLETIAAYRDSLVEIDVQAQDPREPSWVNDWLPRPGRRGHLRLHPKPCTGALSRDRLRQLDQVRGARAARRPARNADHLHRPAAARGRRGALRPRASHAARSRRPVRIRRAVRRRRALFRRLAPDVHELGCDGLLPRGAVTARRRSPRRRARRVPAVRLSAPSSPTATTRSSTCWPPTCSPATRRSSPCLPTFYASRDPELGSLTDPLWSDRRLDGIEPPRSRLLASHRRCARIGEMGAMMETRWGSTIPMRTRARRD